MSAEIAIQVMIQAAADERGVSVERLLSRDRSYPLASARMAVAYAAAKNLAMHSKDIAPFLKREPSSIRYDIAEVKRRFWVDKDLRQLVYLVTDSAAFIK